VTVTHPEIYRYFMTIPEAVQLILQAGAMGKGGEIFLLDMGKPVRIADLARDMIRLSGFEPEKDIRIAYTGLRPGEKLYEELLTDGEEIRSTVHEKIKVAARETIDRAPFIAKMHRLLDSLERGFTVETISGLRGLVPDFQPENGGARTPIEVLRNHSYEVPRQTVELEDAQVQGLGELAPVSRRAVPRPERPEGLGGAVAQGAG
jgi:FlaA1/EpsC-like NDP-sugar epimerase